MELEICVGSEFDRALFPPELLRHEAKAIQIVPLLFAQSIDGVDAGTGITHDLNYASVQAAHAYASAFTSVTDKSPAELPKESAMASAAHALLFDIERRVAASAPGTVDVALLQVRTRSGCARLSAAGVGARACCCVCITTPRVCLLLLLVRTSRAHAHSSPVFLFHAGHLLPLGVAQLCDLFASLVKGGRIKCCDTGTTRSAMRATLDQAQHAAYAAELEGERWRSSSPRCADAARAAGISSRMRQRTATRHRCIPSTLRRS